MTNQYQGRWVVSIPSRRLNKSTSGMSNLQYQTQIDSSWVYWTTLFSLHVGNIFVFFYSSACQFEYHSDMWKGQAFPKLHTRTRTSRYGKYNLVCPSYNREMEGGRTFQASGTKLWNSIPLDICKKDSIGSFKSSVRKYFLAKNS